MKRLIAAAAVVLAAAPAHAIFTNGGFETGNFSGWTQQTFRNNGLSGTAPFDSNDLNLSSAAPHTFEGAVVGAVNDPHAPTLVLPRAGSFTAQVGTDTVGGFAESISQQDVITNADRDATDGKLHVRFSFAAVLEDSGHADSQRPFFFVRLRNITKGTTLYEEFTFEQQPGKTFLSGDPGFRYTPFTNVDIVVPDADLGDTLEIQAFGSDCQPTGHAGYVYLDGFGSAIVPPGPGPAPQPLGPTDIPTLSEWALIALALILGGVAMRSLRGRGPFA